MTPCPTWGRVVGNAWCAGASAGMGPALSNTVARGCCCQCSERERVGQPSARDIGKSQPQWNRAHDRCARSPRQLGLGPCAPRSVPSGHGLPSPPRYDAGVELQRRPGAQRCSAARVCLSTEQKRLGPCRIHLPAQDLDHDRSRNLCVQRKRVVASLIVVIALGTVPTHGHIAARVRILG
jgi:hypothetical protein